MPKTWQKLVPYKGRCTKWTLIFCSIQILFCFSLIAIYKWIRTWNLMALRFRQNSPRKPNSVKITKPYNVYPMKTMGLLHGFNIFFKLLGESVIYILRSYICIYIYAPFKGDLLPNEKPTIIIKFSQNLMVPILFWMMVMVFILSYHCVQ